MVLSKLFFRLLIYKHVFIFVLKILSAFKSFLSQFLFFPLSNHISLCRPLQMSTVLYLTVFLMLGESK